MCLPSQAPCGRISNSHSQPRRGFPQSTAPSFQSSTSSGLCLRAGDAQGESRDTSAGPKRWNCSVAPCSCYCFENLPVRHREPLLRCRTLSEQSPCALQRLQLPLATSQERRRWKSRPTDSKAAALNPEPDQILQACACSRDPSNHRVFLDRERRTNTEDRGRAN